MLYHCDALLPTAERYASLKFRRFSRWFRPTKLAWDDALELVAFVETIGLKHARFVFHWHGQAGVKAYARLRQHMLDEAQPYISANVASLGLDDGLAVLRAMQDGGWQSHGLPNVVRMAIQTLLVDHNAAQVARKLGLTVDQVVWASGRKGIGTRRRQARAISSLGVAS